MLCAFAVFIGFSTYYFLVAFKTGMAGYGPYTPQFDLPTLFGGISIYLQFIAFNLVSLDQALFGFVVLTGIALWTFNRTAILGSIGFFIGTAPVLFLANQRAPYYAYAASAYMALMLVALVQRADVWLMGRGGAVSAFVAKAAVLVTVAWFTYDVYQMGIYREGLLATMRESSRALKALAPTLSHVEEKSKIVITGLPPGVTLFMHAPCYAINTVFEVFAIDCRIVGTDAGLSAVYEGLQGPKILVHYDHGDLAVLARSP